MTYVIVKISNKINNIAIDLEEPDLQSDKALCSTSIACVCTLGTLLRWQQIMKNS